MPRARRARTSPMARPKTTTRSRTPTHRRTRQRRDEIRAARLGRRVARHTSPHPSTLFITHRPTPDSKAPLMTPLTDIKPGLSFTTRETVKRVFNDPEEARAKQRRSFKIVVMICVVALAALFFGSLALDWHFGTVWRYEAAGMFGAAAGAAELLSRYRDAPAFVLLSPPG